MITNNRIAALQSKIAEHGLDGVLYGPSANMQYLLKDTSYYWQRTPDTGFYLLKGTPLCTNELSYFHCKPDILLWIPVTGEAAIVATYERAKGIYHTKTDAVCHYVMLGDYLAPFLGSAKKIGIGLGCESALRRMLSEIDNTIETVPAEFLTEELRMCKDDEEITAMRKVAAFTDYCMGEIIKILKPGVTQWQVECRLNELAVEHSCGDVPFTPSCTFTKTGDPRCSGFGGIPKEEGLTPGTAISFDNGFVMEGYCSDFGRSFYCGKAPQKIADAYKALQTAQLELFEKIKPGVSMSITFSSLYKSLERFGFQDNLRNYNAIGLMGHQISIDVHEEPWLYDSSEHVFKPGMIMCIEPKILFPGEAFMRVEDMVLITESGCESLTKFDRDLYELPA